MLNICFEVIIVWLPVARHDVMHAWLWLGGCHVEPHGGREAKEAVFGDQIRVLEKHQFGVVAI